MAQVAAFRLEGLATNYSGSVSNVSEPPTASRRSRGHVSGQQKPKAINRIKYLHGLRGLAAYGVVVTHTAFYTGRSLHGDAWSRFLSRLDYGVALFFVLSGFLLYRSILRPAVGAGSPVSWKHYTISRFLRIVPVYVVTLLCVWGLFGTAPLSNAGVLQMLTFLKVYTDSPEHPQLTQMWSLDVEVAFYVVLPLLALYAARPGAIREVQQRNLWMLSGGLILWALWLVGIWVTGWVHKQDATLMWLPTKLPWFLGGMGLAVFYVMWRDVPPGQRSLRANNVAQALRAAPTSWVLISAGLALLAATDLAGPYNLDLPGPFESTAKVVLYGLSATFLVALAVCDAYPAPVAAVLEWRPISWLGEISFSLFLIHQIFIVLAADMWGLTVFAGGLVPILAIVSMMSILSAYCLYVFVERPTMQLAHTIRRSDQKNRQRNH